VGCHHLSYENILTITNPSMRQMKALQKTLHADQSNRQILSNNIPFVKCWRVDLRCAAEETDAQNHAINYLKDHTRSRPWSR
jgi:hypothetical protein